MTGSVTPIAMLEIPWDGKKIRLSQSEARELHQAIGDELDKNATPIQIICRVVAAHFNISAKEIFNRGRQHRVVLPRYVAMNLTLELTKASVVSVGKEFGYDHGTVCHAVQVVKDRLSLDPTEQRRYRKLRATLRERLATHPAMTGK